ncbi:MAG TPA: type II toxin-antitoxin system VapC family toxin [Mycobacteriales bacterium]|nr:type II toxin-antitoxin system VapC family toxin [Mycobacteriales bacterium]
MTVVYFDSSALVKLVVGEHGSDVAIALWEHCDVATSSPLAYVEVRAALAAGRRDRRFTSRDLLAATAAWHRHWDSVRVIELTEEVTGVAGALAETHAMRGADAVHLASLLAVGRGAVALAAWDQRLRVAALAEGVLVLPA